MSFATIRSRGRLTIPKDTREAAGLRPGDRIKFTVLESGAIRVSVEKLGIPERARRTAARAARRLAQWGGTES